MRRLVLGLAVASLLVSSPQWANAARSPDTTPPSLVDRSPSAGATDVPITVTPTSVYSESVKAYQTTFKAGTAVITHSVSYNDATRSLVLTPAVPLAYGTVYTVSTRAKDDSNNWSVVSAWSFTTAAAPPVDNPPVADLALNPSEGDVPLTVRLDASGSTDDKGAIASYLFDWGDGTGNSGEQAESVAQHVYTQVGSWSARVTVKDTAGQTTSKTAVVTVRQLPPDPVDNPPVAGLSVTPSSGVGPLNVTADASSSTDDVRVASYAFDWGDGSTTPAQEASTAQHLYENDGTYTVRVTVLDSKDQSSSTTQSVTVTAPPPPPAPDLKPTVVSLTFDDGTSGHQWAAAELQRYGLRGTFYINSGRLGASGYLTSSQVQAINAAGHEIAGHTVDHADLPTLSYDDAKRQVCNDRVALHNLGARVTNFAYPFSSENSQVRTIVQECGYNSARGVASLKSLPYGCANCQTAESIPPIDIWKIRTNSSVKSDTTLDILKSWVTQAENDQGGWVPFVIHSVGSDGGPNTITMETLTQFVDWLSKRPSSTTVKTVDQVIGGAEKPYVDGPPLPGENPNLVLNPSLEVGSGSTPSCFQLGGYGTNTFAWTRTSDAHSGSFAQRVDVTSYTSGDRKLVTKQDLTGNTCAAAPVDGHRYTASVWYKGSWQGSARVAIVTYYRNVNGAWVVWQSGPNVAASSIWVKTTFTTTPIPAGATAVSYGLALIGQGSLTTDDYDLRDIG